MRRCAAILPGAVLLLLTACGGHSESEMLMLDWANVLNVHLTTDRDANYTFPRALSEVKAELRGDLSTVDSWGNQLFYRRIRDDRYQLISGGPDGQLGNDDDIVVENGLLKEPMAIYAERPLKNG